MEVESSVESMFRNLLKKRKGVEEVPNPCSPAPKWNEAAERLNWSSLYMTPTVMISLPDSRQSAWAKALNTACLARNRSVARICKVDFESYDALHGTLPDVSHLSLFGAKEYIYKHKEGKQKHLISRWKRYPRGVL